MLFSRWKVMTGLVGVSLGGLAALAGQLPKDQKLPPLPEVKAAAPEPKPIADVKVPTKPTAVTLPLPVPLPLPAVPPSVTTPVQAVAPSKPVELPPLPLPAEKAATSPVLPAGSIGPPAVPDLPAGVIPARQLPDSISAVPPAPPVAELAPAKPVKPIPPPARFVPEDQFAYPPPVANPPLPTVRAPDPLIVPSKPSVGPAATKFRIVLRVGDGEPSFEVRHGDSLVMKVTCDKVDIKSPEKGQGSNVVATGKVNFVGFGAEGACDSLSFLAGSGEVALTGNVNVKVRDKIGRVESELNADKMQYKLDQTALTGVLKP